MRRKIHVATRIAHYAILFMVDLIWYSLHLAEMQLTLTAGVSAAAYFVSVG